MEMTCAYLGQTLLEGNNGKEKATAFEQSLLCILQIALERTTEVAAPIRREVFLSAEGMDEKALWYLEADGTAMVHDQKCTIKKTSVFEVLQRILERAPKQVHSVVRLIIDVLWHLSERDSSVLTYLITMKTHCTLRDICTNTDLNEDVRCEACGLVRFLALHDRTVLHDAFLSAYALTAVEESDELRIRGARCLALLAYEHDDIAGSMDDELARRLCALLKSGKNEKREERFSEGICSLLNFSSLHRNQLYIARRGLSTIIGIFQNLESLLSDDVCARASALLNNLALASENRTLFYKNELHYRVHQINSDIEQQFADSAAPSATVTRPGSAPVSRSCSAQRPRSSATSRRPQSAASQATGRRHQSAPQRSGDGFAKRPQSAMSARRPMSAQPAKSAAGECKSTAGASPAEEATLQGVELGEKLPSDYYRSWRWRPKSSKANFSRPTADLWGGRERSKVRYPCLSVSPSLPFLFALNR